MISSRELAAGCFRHWVCLLAAVSLAACDRIPFPSASDQETLPPEPWVTQPAAQWPQLVLTNAATFRGHTPLTGASSFLVRNSRGQALAATARHLLGENGGVQPEVALDRFNEVLISWRMYPRTSLDHVVRITELASNPNPKRSEDWLLLSIASNSEALPSAPLTLRAAPVAVGDAIFLVGVPYVEKGRAQNVYHGRVTARGFGDRFRYDLDPPVDIRGFSGAPILDAGGHVVGVMTVWFEPKMRGEKFLEAGGEDAAAIINQLPR